VVGITLTDRTRSTRRGLRVGDSVANLQRLYGEPSGKYEDSWDYQDASNDLHVIRLTVRGDHITAIYLGAILD